MTTTRWVTIFVSALWLTGCGTGNRQATTPTASVTRTSPPALFHTIVIRSNASPVVYIDGEVKRPARLVWTPELTLTNAIEMAGGFTDFANRARVEIRRGDGPVERYSYFRIRRGATNNPSLKRNDHINVPRSVF